ncbi:VOC family protein [Sphingomonas sp.]|uniref:VOC family protein n=1 Tax=Sphingomonas sp. TaxID=28214 RepID=UPI0031D4B58A
MQIAAQLEFDGNCRQAFELYAELFGGEIAVMNALGDTREVPLPPGSSDGGPGMIRFAELRIGDNRILGNDLPVGQYAPPRGFNVAMHVEHATDARRIFDGLAAGGKVTTPLTKVEWAELFGMVTDRFGVPWLILALNP